MLSKIEKQVRKRIAAVLALVMLLSEVSMPVYAEDTYSGYLDGWNVQAAWSTLSSNYVWDAADDGMRQPKLVITYRIDHADRDYPAGSLQFQVPGIGGAVRGTIVRADELAAEKEDSEWSFIWDQEQDLYTFTNDFAVTAGQSISGGFELLWTLEARTCADGFYREASPLFSVDGVGSIVMKPISYHFTSARDRYRIYLNQDKLYAADYEEADKAYVWYEFETRFDKDWLARGLYRSSYYVTVSIPNAEDAAYEDVQVMSGDQAFSLTKGADGNWGFYSFQERKGNLGSPYQTFFDSFQLGFRKETLLGNYVTVYTHLDRLYEDDSEWTTEAAANEITDCVTNFTVEDYSFQHAGYRYDHDSWNTEYENYDKPPHYYWYGNGDEKSHEAPEDYTERLNAVNLYNGKLIQFTMRGQAAKAYASAYSLQRMFAVSKASSSNSAVSEELEATSDTTATAALELASDSDADELNECGDAKAAVTAVASSSNADSQNNTKKGDKNAEPIPEYLQDWNDIHWKQNGRLEESEEENWLSDFILKGIGGFLSSVCVRNPFRMKAYAATLSNAVRTADDSEAENESDNEECGSGIEENQTYSLILGEDKLVIFQKDGSIRRLEDDEYSIAYITVPSDSKGYDYEIFGAWSQDSSLDEYVCIGYGNTGTKQTIPMPSGIRAAYIRVNDITGSYSYHAYAGIRLHLDWTTEQEKEEAEQPDHEARLVNFTYLRSMYEEDGKEVNDCTSDYDSYAGTFGPELAQWDAETYGEQLYRDYSNVWLRSPVTDLKAGTQVAEFTGGGAQGFASVITSSGRIVADNKGTLSRFSLYTVLPDGLQVDLDKGQIEITGSAVDQSGNTVTDFMSGAYIHGEEYQGKFMVAADFDFSANPLEISKESEVAMCFPVTLNYADFMNFGNRYPVRTYLMVHDDGVDKISGEAIMSDEFDLDEDGFTDDKMAYHMEYGAALDTALEWREFASKYVKSDYSQTYEKNAVVRWHQEPSDYSYRMDFGLGSSNAKHITFFDRIERGAVVSADGENGSVEKYIASEWQGNFVSVDTSYAEKMKMIPVIYYSVNADQVFDLSDEGWTQNLPDDPGMVKAIAVSLDTSVMENQAMKAGQLAYVMIHMKAPSDASMVGKKAVNQYTVQYDAYGLTDTYEQTYTLTSSETTVRLLDTVGSITLQKEDADRILWEESDGTKHYAPLTGGKFQVYDYTGVPVFEEAKELNALGRIVIRNIPYGEYYWEEVEAPVGYQKLEGKHPFQIDGITEIVRISNERIPGEVTLIKEDEDQPDYGSLSGAVYELYSADGKQIFTDTSYIYSENGTVSHFATDDVGTISVSGLPWGSYYFLEAEAPDGYERNLTPVTFSIGRAQYDTDTGRIHVEVHAYDQEKTSEIVLIKTDVESGKPIRDAVYSLYRVNREEEAEDTLITSGLKTNAAGEITVADLKFGEYYFVETRNAGGYQMPDSQKAVTDLVVLGAANGGQTLKITHTNERRLGNVCLTKTDDAGQLVGGAEYELFYRPESEEEYGYIGSYTTASDRASDFYGEIHVDGLKWGDYYFIERIAPQGYELSAERVSFAVDRETVQNTIYVDAVDQRRRGTICLMKVDRDDPTKTLAGAEYELYRTDGMKCIAGVDYILPEGVDKIVTGTDGSITISGIRQGAYYLKETKAPLSYSISEEQIRFSVTKENCSVVQQLTAEDEIGKAVITIHKQINEVYEPFGNPTFLFQVRSDDGRLYTRSITIGPDNLSGSTTFTVEQGKIYTITELPSARYRLEKVTAGASASLTADEAGAIVDLTVNTEADVTFSNVMEQYEKYSHTSNVENLIRKSRKLTAIQVNYNGPDPITADLDGYDAENDVYHIPRSHLTVMAYYDDGSAAELSQMSYTLSPEAADGTSDSYTGTVSYTEDGVTRTASFQAALELPVPGPRYTVTYELNGGTIVPDGGTSAQDTYSYLLKGGQIITSPVNDPVREGYEFLGWYEDAAFGQEAEFDTVITSDKKYYAKWELEAVKVRYAVSIYGIQEDLDEQGNTVGLTFGPATGASYVKTYKSHVPAEEGQICMHDMEWSEIIEQSSKDPTVFRECLRNGCTHSVELKIRGPLALNAVSYPNMKGDGAGMLKDSLNPEYLVWNRPNSTYFTTTSSQYKQGTNQGGWQDSAIRNTLNGTVTEAMEAITNKENGFSEAKLDETTALIHAFPDELRTKIVAKAVKSDTICEDSDSTDVTHDRLWLLSGVEVFGDWAYHPNEGTLYSRQEELGITTSSYDQNIVYEERGYDEGWWLRTQSYRDSRIIFKVRNWGDVGSSTVNVDANGITPCFCIPGPGKST